MNRDRPLAQVKISDTGLYLVERIERDGSQFPFEMMETCSGYTLKRFVEARMTPKSRQGLYEDMKAAGIEEYSIAALLKASNGRDCSDPFWIRFEDGPQTWKEVWAAVGVHNK